VYLKLDRRLPAEIFVGLGRVSLQKVLSEIETNEWKLKNYHTKEKFATYNFGRSVEFRINFYSDNARVFFFAYLVHALTFPS
jgi:hypothetical protein